MEKKYFLGELVNIDSGFAFKSSLFTDDNQYIPIIRIRDVNSGEASTYYSGEYDEKYIVNKGDLLISMDGSFVVKKWDSKKALLNQRVCRIKSISDKITDEYLYRILPRELKAIEDKTPFVTVKHLSTKSIENIEIKLPSLEKQKKISEVLDKAQSLIDKKKEQIELLDELVKSRFIEMFINLENESKLSLEKCTNFIDYRGKTPKLSEDGNIRMINAKSVGKGVFKYIDEYISEETYNSWMKRGFPNYGDILFVTEGHTFGNTCIIPKNIGKFAMGQRVITIQGNKETINNSFLYQYMQTINFKAKIDKYKTGSSAQGIRSKELQKILIPIPPIELQNEFAEFVTQTDSIRSKMEASLSELEDNFNSLMQRAFKGELF